MLDHCNVLTGPSLILGDMNFYYDRPDHPSTIKIIDLLDTFSLVQSVTEATHNKGHTLDWVIHRATDNIVKSTEVTQELVSDHYCIVCDLNVSPPSSSRIVKQSRKISAMDRDVFRQDLTQAISPAHCPTVEALDSALIQVLDHHAPLTQNEI